ncbi:MAG: M28 family peptidase [Candidatus Acidiferrales bacterium]
MNHRTSYRSWLLVLLVGACIGALGCNKSTSETNAASTQQAASAQPSYSTANIPTPKTAPDPATVHGFDGTRAFESVRHLVEIGPRVPASDGIHQAQAYLTSELKSYGCPVEEHDFTAHSPVLGEIPMKNIVATIPGSSPGIVILATHYDTIRIPGFVGADDGGSGTATLLEIARVLCSRKEKEPVNVWVTFFDGEETQANFPDKAAVKWDDDNATFGSRELAASMALSGELKNVRAMILTDMVGSPNLKIKRETNSTVWLQKLIWSVAARLGYSSVFVDDTQPMTGDDHFSFIRRGVAGYDIIDFSPGLTYWHTSEDTLEKIDPKSMAIVGHTLLETIPEIAKAKH